MGLFIGCVVYFGAIIFLLFFGKWVWAITRILIGDKSGLHDCNLCEKDTFNPLWNDFKRDPWDWQNKGDRGNNSKSP